MQTKKIIVVSFLILTGFTGFLSGQSYQSFELRYFSSDMDANGETDFKGETEFFSTEQRVEFLSHYATLAKQQFDDPDLNTKVVTKPAIDKVLEHLKPQPNPKIRERIQLNQWKYMGYKKGQHELKTLELLQWKNNPDVSIENGTLTFRRNTEIEFTFPMQSWRYSFEWKAKAPTSGSQIDFSFTERGKIEGATLGFGNKGHFYYVTANNEMKVAKSYEAGKWYTFKVEFDMAAHTRKQDVIRYNLYIDGEVIADYVPMQRVVTEGVGYANNFTSMAGITSMSVRAINGTELDDLWGVGYHYTQRESYPYTVETFLDQNFEEKPDIQGWIDSEYNDTLWKNDSFPIVHGSERHAEEDLYMRKKINTGTFERAFLNIETLDPGGEIWINGRVAAVITNRHPQKIDVTGFLKENEENLIAVKVNHFYLTETVGEIMPHSSLDFNIGWFAGRMSLDLVKHQHINDVFVYTSTISDNHANIRVKVAFQNQQWVSFRGNAEFRFYPWYPEESGNPALIVEKPLVLTVGSQTVEYDLTMPSPVLWTPENPKLYKVQVILKDTLGNSVDDFVITTGIRTVDQAGGSFRLNGKVYMANGAQIMGYKGPIEKLVTWARCAPNEWIAKELMMVKNMNGNFLRVHAHAWEFPARGINDPRYAEMADQLGVMLLWCPTAWIRTGRGWGDIDFEGYPKYMHQVYNHPSIIIWEAANHTQSFKSRDVKESNLFCEKVYNTLYPVDPSRIISYNSFIRHLHYGNDEGTIDQHGNPIDPSWAWTAPKVTRGNQDSPTGYRKEWSVLREYPGEYRQSFLDSKERAYFNFEHQESMAQPNWNLVKGKPWYQLHSYEWDYDEGSIGRRLTLDEWEESQAWQGFGAWEAMKKMRILDYDGFSWCCLHGGANTVTYKKPLIDFLDHAKIAYWTNKMIFQKTVAGSDNVDVVYGPEDRIQPAIMHLGEEKTVNLTVTIKNMEGETVHTKEYPKISLQGGRSTAKPEPFMVEGLSGYYSIHYQIEEL